MNALYYSQYTPIFPFPSISLGQNAQGFFVWIGLEREGWGFWCSQCAYEDLFDCITILSHSFCAKLFPFHLYRWAKGEALHLPIKTNILGDSQLLFYFCDGLIKMTHCTRKRKKSWTWKYPPLISWNINTHVLYGCLWHDMYSWVLAYYVYLSSNSL
jgi:hypothetical protein